MLKIDDWSIEQIKNRYLKKYRMQINCPPRSWQTSRYIQLYLDGYDNMHFEYRITGKGNGRVELHFEGDLEKYYVLIDNLMNFTQNSEELIWSDWGEGYRCKHYKKINTIEELFQTMTYMIELFEKLIGDLSSENPIAQDVYIPSDKELPQQDENGNVDLFELKYEKIVCLPLHIPNYQRIYCWEEKNVKCLLDDLSDYLIKNNSTPYRLGTIILHSYKEKYDIIDGQQRLVTLSLLLSEIGVKTGLLNESFTSRLSIEYIAYNKHIIHEYVQRHLIFRKNANKLLALLEFSVLVLHNSSIDLAYTFFSNQNSRGVMLTDYDLLKAHHLRYIPSSLEQQSKRAAEVWNKMIEDGRKDTDQTSDPDYVRTLDTYIYRLRRWMRKNECNDSKNNYRIKREYEAAPVVEEIPPFGGKFYFNEPIQGGSHFFSYVEQHIKTYKYFCQTEEYTILHNSLQGGSDQLYRDVIEGILFGYFLKFGNNYLSDALVVIMRILLQHRYTNSRAIKSSILAHAGNSELVLIIDQATSPTFFLAEARNIAKDLSYPNMQNMIPIQRGMRKKASRISQTIEKNIVVESFKNLNNEIHSL